MGKSYAILRVQKVKIPAVSAMQYHNDRMPGNHDNPDIDPSRTGLNYELCRHLDYTTEVEGRIVLNRRDSRKLRKDAVVLVEGIATASPEWFAAATPEEQRRFFEDCRDFVAEKFGEENLVHFTVHLDEATPHAHFGFVPLKDGSLSWKNFFPNKIAMSKMQDEFYRAVGEPRGLARGEKREPGAPAKRHKSVREYKREASRLEAEIKEERERLESVRQEIGALEGEVEKLEAEPAGSSVLESALEIGRAGGSRKRARELGAREQLAADEAQELDGRISDFEKRNEDARSRNQQLGARRDGLAGAVERLGARLVELGESLLAALDRLPLDLWPHLSHVAESLVIERDTERIMEGHPPLAERARRATDSPAYDLAGEYRDLRAWGGGTEERAHSDWGDDAI